MTKRIVDDKIHSEPWFQSLSTNAKLVYLLLYTGPKMTISGIYPIDIEALSKYSDLSSFSVFQALDEMDKTQGLTFCKRHSTAFVADYTRANAGSPNTWKSAVTFAANSDCPECTKAFWDRYEAMMPKKHKDPIALRIDEIRAHENRIALERVNKVEPVELAAKAIISNWSNLGNITDKDINRSADFGRSALAIELFKAHLCFREIDPKTEAVWESKSVMRTMRTLLDNHQ